MEASELLAAQMMALRDAHMTRLPHRSSFPCANAPLDVVHLDVVRLRLSRSTCGHIDDARLGMRHGVMFVVDDCSRRKRVFFCMGKDEVPALLRLFLLEIDLHAVYGPHFVMRDGFRQLQAHSH